MSAHCRKAKVDAISCAVITVSDTRTTDTDRSGKVAQDLIQEVGFSVSRYQIVPDEPALISRSITDALLRADAILLTGGTGVSPRDNTVPTLVPMLDKELPGFGELFRMLSYEEIGSASMLSCATGGISGGVPIFAMPGSPKAVALALKKLILPELPHLLSLIRRRS